MSTLVTRAGKGSPLTHNEVDANFNNLNTDKIQSGNTVAALTITSATITDLAVTGITSFDGAQGTAGQVLTSSGTGATPTWTTPSASSGTVTSVAATVPSVLSITGSPITTSGTLAFTYSGTALPVANGGSGQTTYTNGQLLIGNTTGNTLTKATLTAGSGISITNGSGEITIANTSSVNSSQLAKAFVQWQGSNGTINRSYNVSSVTRNGTGNYTVTFSTAFAASYAIVLGGSRNNGRTDAFGLQYYGQSTTSVNIDTYLPAITYTDAYTADLVCFD